PSAAAIASSSRQSPARSWPRSCAGSPARRSSWPLSTPIIPIAASTGARSNGSPVSSGPANKWVPVRCRLSFLCFLYSPYACRVRTVRPSPVARRSGHKLTLQCPLDEDARLPDSVKCYERAEARSAFLAEQHLIDHLEERPRYAGAAGRALPGVILVALDLPRHVQCRALDRLAVGSFLESRKLFGQPAKRLALDLIRRAETLRRAHEIVEVADGVVRQAVELGMRLRRHSRRITRDEAPQDRLVLRVGGADEIEQQRKGHRKCHIRRVAVMDVPDRIPQPALPVLRA